VVAIRALLDRGVDVRELVTDGRSTLLHHAAHHANANDVLDMLVNVCGVPLEARNSHGRTCTHVAVDCMNVAALCWLIDAGANVNCADNDGLTPLHYVCDYHCVTVLLAAGADVCARDKSGGTALDRAVRFPRNASAHALLAGGADLDAANGPGETARQVLAHRGRTIHADIVELARRDIGKARLEFVRDRALQVCIGLQSLRIDALQICEILQFSCGPVAPFVPFHIW
jgi:ankyrin repeat protein